MQVCTTKKYFLVKNKIFLDFLMVFPNPTTGSFMLELATDPAGSIVVVRCYNLMGLLILEKTFTSGTRHELNLAGNGSGIYLLRMIRDGNAEIQKIILQ